MISLKRVKLTMQKLHYKVAPTWQKMYGGRQGMGCNSENKYLLASRQSLYNQEHEKNPSGLSHCAADSSCLNALHDGAQPLNAFAGFVCVWMSQAVALSCFYCCVCCVYFMVFYQWISQPVFSVITSAQFMADMLWVVWFFKQKLHILKL